MKQYHVTGMSCAACSARVEKAVSGVPGVTACSVSLLTNSMGVEGTAADQAIIDAVQAAGYGASVKGAQQSANPAAGVFLFAFVVCQGRTAPQVLCLPAPACGSTGRSDVSIPGHTGHLPAWALCRFPQ